MKLSYKKTHQVGVIRMELKLIHVMYMYKKKNDDYFKKIGLFIQEKELPKLSKCAPLALMGAIIFMELSDALLRDIMLYSV